MTVRLSATEVLDDELVTAKLDTSVVTHEQAVAASNTDHLGIMAAAGEITSFVAFPVVGAAAGESMVLDLLKNSATMLSATITLDNGTGTGVVSGTIDPAKKDFVAGDVIEIQRTYVAGGGPAMTFTVGKAIFNLG